MEQVTGRSARALQRELGSLVYCNPEGGQWETADRYLSGDVRRKLAVATAAAGARSGIRAQHRSAEGGTACRPGAGRHRGPPRLVVDSGNATSGTSSARCSDIAPRNVARRARRPHRDLDGRDRCRREIQRRQHDDARHGALPRLRADRAGAQRPRADRL